MYEELELTQPRISSGDNGHFLREINTFHHMSCSGQRSKAGRNGICSFDVVGEWHVEHCVCQ